MQVRTPGMISVPSRFLPLTAFRELLFGPALSLSLSRVSWVSPLVLTGSFSSSHTSACCSSEARGQYAVTVSRQKLHHGSSFLSPLQVGLSSAASLLMFLCQVPTARRRAGFNREVDVLLTGVRKGQVQASGAVVRFFLSRLVGNIHTSLMRRARVSSTGTASDRHRELSRPRNAVLDRCSSSGGTPLNIVRNLWKDVRTLDIDGFIAQKRADRWHGHCSDRRHSIGISCVCLRFFGGFTLQVDALAILRSLNIPPVKEELVGGG